MKKCMEKIKVSSNVKVKTCGDQWDNRKGEVLAVCKNKREKEYVVQFKRPVEWYSFPGQELDLI